MPLFFHELRGNAIPFGIDDLTALFFPSIRQFHLANGGDREGFIVIDHNGLTADVGVHLANDGADAMGEHVGEGLQAEQFVIPRELVGPRNAGAREVVVELMPDDTAPGLGELLSRIVGRAEPVGHDGSTLCCIAQMLVLSVIEFHRCLRGVASVAVQVHGELAVEERQLRMLVERQIVFVQLVTGGTDNLYGAIAADAFLDGTYRGDVR